MPNPANDNEALVLRFFDRLSDGDLESVRALLHEDATWTPQVRGIPGAGTHRGRAGIIDGFLGPIRGTFRPGEPKVHVDSLASGPGFVMAETRGIGRIAANDREYLNHYAWAIEIKDGLLFNIREYMDGLYVKSVFFDPDPVGEER